MQFLEAKKWEGNMARKCAHVNVLSITKTALVVKSKLIAIFYFSDLSENSLSSIETGTIEELEQLVLL